MRLTEFCIRRPVFTTVISLVIIVLGIIGFTRVPVRGYPNISVPVISVSTTYDGASATIIESQITTPIENDLVGSPGLQSIHSYSDQGKSRIILKYKLGVDINNAASDVRNRLSEISRQLPEDADAPVVEKRDPDDIETVYLALSDPRSSLAALTDYANRTVLPELEQVVGVASVELHGDRDYAMQVLLNPAKMAANQVTVKDLTKALQKQNVNTPSGAIKNNQRNYSVYAQGELSSAKAFKQLVIRDKDGYLLRFGDVAHIKVGPETIDSSMQANGKSAVGLGVFAQSTANPIEVAKRIDHEVKKIQMSLPSGMQLKVVWHATDYLQATLNDVYWDIAFAMLLVVVVVLAFLGSWRSALIPVVTIPICLLGVFIFIYALGYSINIFTLLALVLAVGLVVDDAIVMLENIYRYVEQGESGLQAAIKGSREIAFAIVAMTLTLAAVYAPIGFATGMTGVIFRQFAFTLALAVIISGFIALTLSPMMSAKLLHLPKDYRGMTARYTSWLDHLFEKLLNAYQQLLKKILHHRMWVVLTLLVIAVLGVWCFMTMPSALSPQEDMGAFLVKVTPPPNASFQYMNRYNQKVSKLLLKIPEVSHVVMHTDLTRGGFAFVELKPWDQRKRSAKEVRMQFLKAVHNIPGSKVAAFNMSQLGGGGKYGDSIRLVIYTNNSYLDLYHTVQAFLQKAQAYPGIQGTDQDLQMNEQQYVVHIRRSLAAAMDVDLQDVNQALKTMLGGSKITSFNWDDRDYDVLLKVPDKDLRQMKIIGQLYVRNKKGKMIPLSALAKIKTVVGPQELPHDQRQRADTISIQTAPGYSMGQVVHYLQQLAKTNLPVGYTFDFKGAAKRLLQSKHTMLGAFVLAIVFIYLVMAAQFESFIDPLIIMLVVPFSIFGAVFTLKLTANEFSIYTNIGFVTLIGLIAKHGILITEFANQKRAAGQAFTPALIEASAQRLRPILMTTFAMVIGAVPLAFATGAGAMSRQHIGWVIVGGMLFGTFFSLVVVPVAYSYLGRFKKIS